MVLLQGKEERYGIIHMELFQLHTLNIDIEQIVEIIYPKFNSP